MAQLDRATVCGTVGRRFESSWARSFLLGFIIPYLIQFVGVRVFNRVFLAEKKDSFLNKTNLAVIFNIKENSKRK